MITTALGAQGSGKTHALAVELRAQYQRRLAEGRNPHVFVLDRRCYWPVDRLVGQPLARGGGAIQPRTLGSLIPPACWYAGPGDWLSDPKPPRLVGFHQCDATEVMALAKRCFDRRVSAIVAIDELDQLPMPLKGTCGDAYEVAHYGRRIPIDVLGSARRPENLDKVWISDAALLLIFQLREPLSLAYLEKTGIQTTDGRRLRDVVPALPEREHLRIEQKAFGDPD